MDETPEVIIGKNDDTPNKRSFELWEIYSEGKLIPFSVVKELTSNGFLRMLTSNFVELEPKKNGSPKMYFSENQFRLILTVWDLYNMIINSQSHQNGIFITQMHIAKVVISGYSLYSPVKISEGKLRKTRAIISKFEQ